MIGKGGHGALGDVHYPSLSPSQPNWLAHDGDTNVSQSAAFYIDDFIVTHLQLVVLASIETVFNDCTERTLGLRWR
jgi:hypothetical protein